MHGDVLMKFLLTTGGVWLVLELARRCGDRVAGWTAGLPIMSAPTLVMLGVERGDACVAQAATGAMLAVVGSAAFAVVYLAIARQFGHRRWSRTISLAGALLAVAVMSGALGAAAGAGWLGIATAFLLASLACASAAVNIRAPVKADGVEQGASVSPVLVALLVGAISTALSSLAAGLPASACGLLAGLPTTCVVVLARQHRAHGLDGVARLLEGYVRGLGTRIAFMAAVACAGTTGWAVAIALGVTACVLWSAVRFDCVSRVRPALRALVAMLTLTATAAVWPQEVPLWATIPTVPALPVPQQAGYVDHDGARLYYAAFNRQGGSPVVLLHGGFASSDSWGYEVPLLAGRHEVIVTDTRGHGRSTMPPAPLSYTQMAADVIAVLDALNIGKASIVGSSDGGIVGLILGFRYTDRVDKLFIWGASFDVRSESTALPDPAMKGMGAVFMARMQAQYRAVSPTPERFGDLRAALIDLGRREPDLAPAQLARIAAKTVIADGEHEQFIDRSHTLKLAALVPGSSLLILPNVSHGGPQQDPAGFHAAVAALLDAHVPPERGGGPMSLRAQPTRSPD